MVTAIRDGDAAGVLQEPPVQPERSAALNGSRLFITSLAGGAIAGRLLTDVGIQLFARSASGLQPIQVRSDGHFEHTTADATHLVLGPNADAVVDEMPLPDQFAHEPILALRAPQTVLRLLVTACGLASRQKQPSQGLRNCKSSMPRTRCLRSKILRTASEWIHGLRPWWGLQALRFRLVLRDGSDLIIRREYAVQPRPEQQRSLGHRHCCCR